MLWQFVLKHVLVVSPGLLTDMRGRPAAILQAIITHPLPPKPNIIWAIKFKHRHNKNKQFIENMSGVKHWSNTALFPALRQLFPHTYHKTTSLFCDSTLESTVKSRPTCRDVKKLCILPTHDICVLYDWHNRQSLTFTRFAGQTLQVSNYTASDPIGVPSNPTAECCLYQKTALIDNKLEDV